MHLFSRDVDIFMNKTVKKSLCLSQDSLEAEPEKVLLAQEIYPGSAHGRKGVRKVE